MVEPRAAWGQAVPADTAIALRALDNQDRFVVKIAHNVTEAQFRTDRAGVRSAAHRQPLLGRRRDHPVIPDIVADGPVTGAVDQIRELVLHKPEFSYGQT